MSANQYLLDGATRHQLLLQRYGGGIFNRVKPALSRTIKELEALVRDFDATEFQINRRFELLAAARDLLNSGMDEVQSELFDELDTFFAYEMDFASRLLQSAVTVEVTAPALSQVAAVAQATRMTLVSGDTVETKTLRDIYREFSSKKTKQAEVIIQSGFIAGKTTPEIARDLRRDFGSRTTRQLETLVRTATNKYADEARNLITQENADVLEGEEWVATLDGRTTVLCGSRDGQVYPVGQGPRTPAHYNCRSLRVPKVKDEFALDDIGGQRTSKDGLVNAQTTYNGWLKRQPASFQNEVLGETRAKLFRNGGLSLKKFVDSQGRLYDLETLQQLEPLAFEKVAI